MVKRILEVVADNTPFVEWSLLIKTSYNEDIKFKVTELDEMTASEAILGFCGWLTSRETRTIMSSRDNASEIVKLIGEFCKVNNLTPPREDWDNWLKHPEI